MRFLVFVPCGRRKAAAAATTPGRAEEETSSIINQSAPAQEKRRRRAGRAGAPSWRPSLSAISEDAALRPTAAVAEDGEERRRRQPPVEKAKATARIRARDYRDDYRHFTAPAMIPAYAPTAFLF